MKTSEKGVAYIFDREVDPRQRNAATYTAFLDTIAKPPVWTIGVGHTNAAGPPTVVAGMTVSRAAALSILGDDLAKVEVRVAKAFGRDIPQNVFDGAVSFDFNCGGIFRATWVHLWLQEGASPTTEEWFKKWNHDGEGNVVTGLTNRRRWDWKVIGNADYTADEAGYIPLPTPRPTIPPPAVPVPVKPPVVVVPVPAPEDHWFAKMLKAIFELFGGSHG